MTHRLQGNICIVTGGGQGIGAAVADCFAREGASLVIAELDEAMGAAKARELAVKGAPSMYVHTDVAQPESVQTMVAATLMRFGRIDVLVNNAGINVFREPLKTTADDWTLCMSVDLDGMWHCCQAALPSMSCREARRDRPDPGTGIRVFRSWRARQLH